MTATTRRTTTIASLILATFVLASGSHASAQALCDPESFSTIEADFAELTADDFEDLQPTLDWTGNTLARSEVFYYGDFAPATSWCIPGMDGDIVVEPWSYSCGGDNVYLATAMDLHLEPTVPSDVVGFRYGTQGPAVGIQVTLSDGSVRSFTMTDGPTNPWGSVMVLGFFGYCTGDPSLTVVDVHVTGADGGIDDVRAGTFETCEDLDEDGFSTCDGDCDDADYVAYPGAPEICDEIDNSCDGLVDIDTTGSDVCVFECNTDTLAEDVLALGLHHGFENSLLAKVSAAAQAIDGGRNNAAIGVLTAMVSQLNAQRDKKIDGDSSDALIECISAIITQLEG